MGKLNFSFTFGRRRVTWIVLLLFTLVDRLLLSLDEGDKTLLADHDGRHKQRLICLTKSELGTDFAHFALCGTVNELSNAGLYLGFITLIDSFNSPS